MSLFSNTSRRFFLLAVSGFALAMTSATGNAAEKEPLTAALQGYWKGYSKENCFDPASKGAELNIYARVRDNRFDFELRPYSQDKGELKAFQGTGYITSEGQMTFAGPFDSKDKMIVSFQNLISLKSVTIKNCNIQLRKTAFATLPDYFVGDLALEEKNRQSSTVSAKKPAQKKDMVSKTNRPPVPRQKSQPGSPTNVTQMDGTWSGKGGYGCLYIGGRPIEPEIVTDIQKERIDIALSYKSPNAGKQVLYKGQHTLSANGWVAIERLHPDVGQTQISINKQQKLVFAKLGKTCEIQLAKGRNASTNTVTASVRKVTSAPAAPQIQKNPTPPQTPGLSKKEQKRFQGYWTGFAGSGCIDAGGWPASVDVGAYIEKNKLKLFVEYATVWRKGSIPLKAEVNIPTSKKMVFKRPFGDVNIATVLFKSQEDRIEIQMDSDCKINLKRTSRRTVPANFVPDRTKADRT